ncbi:unnamed protein product, partial [Pelagomonas calceolata]
MTPPPPRGRFYVEKFLGLKHSVGVACIGCVYLSKAAGAFTFAVALLIAQALEPRFENLYDPVVGAFSWGGFIYTDECIADEVCAQDFLNKTRDAIAFAASYGVLFLLLTALVFLVYGCLALKAADGSVSAARRVYVFTTALAVLCVFGLFDGTGFVALILTAYAAVVGPLALDPARRGRDAGLGLRERRRRGVRRQARGRQG